MKMMMMAEQSLFFVRGSSALSKLLKSRTIVCVGVCVRAFERSGVVGKRLLNLSEIQMCV